MVDENTKVGGLELPLSAGASGSSGDPIEDPFATALLDLVAHTLKAALDARLANHAAVNVSDACPAANRFPFDPFSPRANPAGRRVPALYLWWDGRSTTHYWSTVRRYRKRNLQCLYVFAEAPQEVELKRRAHLFNAVDSALQRLSQRGYHQTWVYDGNPAGTPLIRLFDEDAVEWCYLGGAGIKRFAIDRPQQQANALSTAPGRDYPAFLSVFEVKELIQTRQATDLNQGGTLTIDHDEVELLQRDLEPYPPE